VTLRETLLLITFLAILYGVSVIRGDRDALWSNVYKTPILLAVFVLWRVVQHCRRVQHPFAQSFVDVTLGAAVGTMVAVLAVFLFPQEFSGILIPLFAGAALGAITGCVLGLVSRRYRCRRTTDNDR
jgi:VIT1/CCC1 family predicted Fe2+/Mn2+ transporter